MCGSCYNDFSPNDITIVSMAINPNGTGSQFCKQLCSKCLQDPFYSGRITKTEKHRKFN
jgi:hypothetical protein